MSALPDDSNVIELKVVDNSDSVTREELAALKQLAANYNAAKIGVTAVVALGGFFAAAYHAWQWINGLKG